MKLVIIESPGKSEALKKYLGEGYEVMPSKGHVRDLPQKELGVNISNKFEPTYQIMPDKKMVVSALKQKASKAEEVFLATDPDREGEAISWHIAYCLGIPEDKPVRIEFNEISKSAVQKALLVPRKINMNLVNSQQARRVLDRLVGYKVSPILNRKIAKNLSAGRVQSASLLIVAIREKEILEFKPEEYWNIWAELQKKDNKLIFKANLLSESGKKLKVTNKEKADEVILTAKNNDFIVSSIKKTKTKQHASAPFITSTMQQEAMSKLGMVLARTSLSAQQLYEGVEVPGEGKIALITYIRTDSTRVSEDAQKAAREFISSKYGKDYVPEKTNIYASKKTAQDAHEAIRPINLDITPEMVKASISNDNYRLYKLIYERFLASQMTEAIFNNVIVDFDIQKFGFRATGKTLEFAGFSAVYKLTEDEKEESTKIPPLVVGEVTSLKELKAEQKFTKPPLRYTDGSLVKAMEDYGIGRPGTFAPTVAVLCSRHYLEKDGKFLVPTELGLKVNEFLQKYFKDIINIEFTAEMEEKLDMVAEDGSDWQKLISNFYGGFKELLKNADSGYVEKAKPIETDEVCEKCGAKMFLRESKYGKFLGCSAYPKCKNIKSIKNDVEKKTYGKCPICGKPMFMKKSKTGKFFFSCSGYPECKFLSWDVPTGEKCKVCGEHMVTKNDKVFCSNRKCGKDA
ncbi:MAG: type I DNA topoisomerase [Clostridia bacterium]